MTSLHGRGRRLLRMCLMPVALVLAVRASHAAGCTKDTDCKGERICEAGKCVAPPVAAPEPSAAEAPPPSSPTPTTPEPAPPQVTLGTPHAAAPSTPAPTAGPLSASVANTSTQSAGSAKSPLAPALPATPLVSAPLRPEPKAEERKRSKAPLVFGIISLSTGYVIAVASAIVAGAYASEQTAQSGGTCIKGAQLAYIPLIGPFLTLSQYPSHDVVAYNDTGPTVYDCGTARGPVTALIIVDEVLQLTGAGLIGLHIGLHSGSSKNTTGHLEILPFAPGGAAGVTLRLRGM